MYDKKQKLNSITLYKEDLLNIEKIIKENLISHEVDKELIDIKITLKDQTLEIKGMEEALKKVTDLQIQFTDKLEISALGWKDNKIIQSVNISYYHNHGNLTIRGDNKVWVEGMYSLLVNRLNEQREKHFVNRYHKIILFLIPIMNGFLGGLGIINLVKFIIHNNYSSLLLAVIFFSVFLIALFKNIEQKLSPFVRIFFYSVNEKKKIDKRLIFDIIFFFITFISVIIGLIQIIS